MVDENVLKSEPYAGDIARARAVLAEYPEDVADTALKLFRCQDCVCSRTRSLFIDESTWFPLDEMDIKNPHEVRQVCEFAKKHLREGVFNELEHVPVPSVEMLVNESCLRNITEGYQQILDGYDPDVAAKALKVFKLLDILRKIGAEKRGSYYNCYFKKLEDCSIHRHLDLVNMCEYVKKLGDSKMLEDFDDLPEADIKELLDSRYGYKMC